MKKRLNPLAVSGIGVLGLVAGPLSEYLKGNPTASVGDALSAVLPSLLPAIVGLFVNPWLKRSSDGDAQ